MTRRVLVTRGAGDLAELERRARPAGIQLIPYPVLSEVELQPDETWERVESLLPRLGMVVFTSRRGVTGLIRVSRAPHILASVRRLPAAAVGAASAEAARDAGFELAIEGPGTGAALAALLLGRLVPGQAVLHPCGRDRREELPRLLDAGGVDVVPLVVYGMDRTPPASLPALDGDIDAVVLTSPRAAAAYLEASGGRFRAVPHVVMGPTTAEAAASLGLSFRVPSASTPEAVVEELCQT